MTVAATPTPTPAPAQAPSQADAVASGSALMEGRRLAPGLWLRPDGTVEKRPRPELGGLGRALLQHEAEVLARLGGRLAPQLIGFEADVLRRQFVAGEALSEVDPNRWDALLREFAAELAGVHALGLVHGDLRPENLILSGDRLVAVDWEHALPMGAAIAELPFRAATPGLSDPRLIWGRGQVDADLDGYSISRMLNCDIAPTPGQDFEDLNENIIGGSSEFGADSP